MTFNPYPEHYHTRSVKTRVRVSVILPDDLPDDLPDAVFGLYFKNGAIMTNGSCVWNAHQKFCILCNANPAWFKLKFAARDA